MKVLKIAGGGKRATQTGEFVSFPSTPGAVKFSLDFNTKFGIAPGDFLLMAGVEFDESDNVGFVGKAYCVQKTTKDNEKAFKVGGKSGNFLGGSNSEAAKDCRSAEYAGVDVSNGEDGSLKQKVTYKVIYATLSLEEGVEATNTAILVNPSVKDIKPRGEGAAEDDEEEEDEIELAEATEEAETTEEVVEDID